MYVLVIGATGRTGRHIVTLAAQAGHQVTAFARSAASTSWPQGVRAVAGDVLDADAVNAAILGQDAVVVALSMVRTSDNPWAQITTPHDLHSQAAAILLAGARSADVRRYLMISAQGVGPSQPRAGWAFLQLVHRSNIGVAYRNLAHAEELVFQSDLDWTIVRPTRLSVGDAQTAVAHGDTLATTSFDHVPRAAVARFLVDALDAPDTVGHALTLTQAAS